MIFDTLQSMSRMTEAADPESGPNSYTLLSLPAAGINVTNRNALCIAAVWECVRIISETLAMLPWRAFETIDTDGRKRRQILEGSHLDYLLHKAPNTEMPALFFKEAIQAHALLWGNGFAEIERPLGKTTGEPVALHLLTPDTTRPKRTAAGNLYFEIRNPDGSGIDLAPERIFHVRGPSWDGHDGYNLVKMARETLSTALATEQFTSAFFGNGAQLGGVIQAPAEMKSLGEEGTKNLLKSFNRRHRGARNAHKVEFLDKGMEYQELGVNPERAQLIEAKKFNVLDVARWFRMPPHKLAHLDDSIKANIESQGIEFVTDTMLPWLLRWEQEADFKFFDSENRGRMFTKMDLKALLRGDSEARAKYYKGMFEIAALDVNEIRELEELDSLGEIGELRVVPMNMVSLEEANRTGNTGMTKTRSTDAHTSVFEDVVDRMAAKECQALTRRAKLPAAEFIAFIDEFYVVHRRQFTQALLRPALSLAEFYGSDGDGELVGEAIEEFVDSHTENAITRLQASAGDESKIAQYVAIVKADVSAVAIRIASTVVKTITKENTDNA